VIEMERTLCRSRDDRSLAGVCGGIAEYFGWSSTRVRVAWILLALCGGSGVLLYLLLWLVMPAAP
jgi:phage shock protein PspC (stress-responsive transcriptional regulator)